MTTIFMVVIVHYCVRTFCVWSTCRLPSTSPPPRWTTLVTFCWLWSSSHSSCLQRQMLEWWFCHHQPIVLPPRLTPLTSKGNVAMTASSNTADLSYTMWVGCACVLSPCYGWTVAAVVFCIFSQCCLTMSWNSGLNVWQIILNFILWYDYKIGLHSYTLNEMYNCFVSD